MIMTMITVIRDRFDRRFECFALHEVRGLNKVTLRFVLGIIDHRIRKNFPGVDRDLVIAAQNNRDSALGQVSLAAEDNGTRTPTYVERSPQNAGVGSGSLINGTAGQVGIRTGCEVIVSG